MGKTVRMRGFPFFHRGGVVSQSRRMDVMTRDCVNRIVRDNMVINGFPEGDPEIDGPRFVRYEGAIQGLCDALMMVSDPLSRAAISLDYILNMHPFVDGNKRTGLAVASRFIASARRRLPNDDEDTYLFIRRIAAEGLARDEIEDWLRENTVSSPSASRRRTGNGP